MQTFTPEQYLKIDIASNFGLDKEDWDVRIEWFDENEKDLESLYGQADEPALFYAGVQAWIAAKAGRSFGYPISLDATSSGAQLLAVLIGCRKSAQLCNVVDTGRREDLYNNIYNLMCNRLNDRSRIDRKDTKQAIMTSLYGSKAMPKQVFGEGELLSCFYATMEEETPGIWELNKALLDLWQPNAMSHDWILPDHFHVKTKTMDEHTETVHFLNQPYEVNTRVNRPTKEGLSIGANVVHSIDGMVVREIVRRCAHDQSKVLELMEALQDGNGGASQTRAKDKKLLELWDRYKQTGFLSARVLDFLDRDNIKIFNPQVIKELLLSMPEKPFHVLAIHDCFRVHPNYGNDLRKQYNQILHELAKSDVLASIAGQIVGHSVNVTKYDDIAADILQADYALS